MAATPEPQPSSSPSFDWKAFCQKTWVIVVAGLALPPVGMILAWLKRDWMSRTKWIAIGVFGQWPNACWVSFGAHRLSWFISA